jgi:xanthine/CO dehydrogenase XdhC/CoxF family maturation factor
MHEIEQIIAAIKRMQRGIIATVVSTQGSTYRRSGARAVISESGELAGTISGGCLERDLALRLREWLPDMQPRVITYDSSRDDDIVFGLGLGCRGVIEVHIEPFDATHPPRLLEFQWNGREPVTWTTSIDGRVLLVESIRPPRALAIFGGGPDVEPLARVAEQIGFCVSRFAARDVHPEKVRDSVDLSPFDAAVIMTHNYLYDQTLLAALLPSPIPYVGLLGPKSRGEELLAQIEVTAEQRARLHSPIGLDLGGETPEQIALAIVAEIEAFLNRGSARSLRELDRPVHVRSTVPRRRDFSL